MSKEKKMQRVTCFIELGGDPRSILYRGADNPVPWPEVAVLQALHGQASVHTFAVADTVDRPTPWTEKQRLISVYGPAVVDAVYPGNRPNMEWFIPSENDDDEDDEEDTAPKPKARRVPAGVITEG